MYIPKAMTKKISDIFYDKTISVLEQETSIDDEGGVTNKAVSTKDNFNGNVSFSNCKKIQEDYGLDYQIDVSITTDYNSLALNDMISYQGIVYNVTDILKSDSHNLIVATKWRQ